MSLNQTQFEYFPNEILIEIFEYFNASDLYHTFYNLNLRFNRLLQSLDQLYLILPTTDLYNSIYLPYISTLIINKRVDIIFNQFIHIRRLILHWLPDSIINKLKSNILPNLEYLYINSRQLSIECWKNNFYDKIFTNGFPRLKSCFLLEMNTIKRNLSWCHTPSIKILKIGSINLFVYQKILLSCTNLNLFEFGIAGSDQTLLRIKHHMNVKTLVIKKVHCLMMINMNIMNMFLSCVPNLTRLDIRLKNLHISVVHNLLEFDWLQQIIDVYLTKLRRIGFYLPVVLATKSLEFHDEQILYELENDFKEKHKKSLYQSELIIDRKPMEKMIMYRCY